jgi:host factor-I protein
MSTFPNQFKPLSSYRTIQNHFLSYVIEQNIPVYIFLKNGVRLVGLINNFDHHTISLSVSSEKQDNSLQVIYRHAISTISDIR